jgi:hypothetical protein
VTKTGGVPPGERAEVHDALVNASVYAFRIGLGISAVLAVLGGLVSLIGIENPRRKVPCADCPGGALAVVNLDVSRNQPAPEPVAASAQS